MPITCEYEYHRPATLKDALALVKKHACGARILAGGTDLIVRLKEGIESPTALIDIKGIPGMADIEEKNGTFFFGAGVTFTALLESEAVKNRLPALWEAAKTVACGGIRNRATLAGNICSAVPSLDSAPALLCYGAVVHTDGARGKKKIPLGEWFLGPKKTVLCEGEMVTGISVPAPKLKHAGAYCKLGRYHGEDLAQAGLCLLAFENKTYRLAVGAVAPTPKRITAVEKLVEGQDLTPELLYKAKAILAEEINPISDIRASAEYRTHMIKVLWDNAAAMSISRLEGKGPDYGFNSLV